MLVTNGAMIDAPVIREMAVWIVPVIVRARSLVLVSFAVNRRTKEMGIRVALACGTVGILLVATAVAAMFGFALRAASADPAQALRQD